MSWRKAVWQKGSDYITGSWYYIWSSDKFVIYLDGEDEITGSPRKFSVSGDNPNFNGWKQVKYGFAVKKTKKKTYVCITKNGAADNFDEWDYEYIEKLLGGKQTCVCEGVFTVPSTLNIESTLRAADFDADEQRAVAVLEHLKERGTIKGGRRP